MPEIKISQTLVLKGRDKLIACAAGTTLSRALPSLLLLCMYMSYVIASTSLIVSAVVVLFIGGGTLFAVSTIAAAACVRLFMCLYCMMP
jgi:hypothetical protein